MADHHIYTTKHAAETQKIGSSVGRALKAKSHPALLCFYGPLGSGKTTFIQGIMDGLGYCGRVTSPTFVISKVYHLDAGTVVNHVDLYRIKEHVPDFGLSDFIKQPDAITMIEWAEYATGILPENRMDIHMKSNPDGTHTIDIYG